MNGAAQTEILILSVSELQRLPTGGTVDCAALRYIVALLADYVTTDSATLIRQPLGISVV